jgi:hypothetical protein
MQSFATLAASILVLPALVAPMPAGALAPDDPPELEFEDRTWVQCASYDVPESMVSRPENAGAHGASVVGFKVGKDVSGSMIITVIDRPAVAAFVGWTVPDKYVDKAADDLRAVFDTSDGNAHILPLAAGGGYGLLFHSPDGLDIATVQRVSLYRDKRAKWAR